MAPVHTALPRNPVSGISGRLGSMSTIKGNPKTSRGPNLSHPDKAGLDHQPPKVSAASLVRSSMARGTLATSRGPVGTTTRQDPCPTIHSKGSIFSSNSTTEDLGTVRREARLRMSDLTAPSAAPPTIVRSPMLLSGQIKGRSNSSPHLSYASSSAMDNGRHSRRNPALSLSTPYAGPLDRRLENRLGRPHSYPPSLRSMVSRGNRSSHQYPGNKGGPLLHLTPQPTKLPATLIHRQSADTLCNKQITLQIKSPSARATTTNTYLKGTTPLSLGPEDCVFPELQGGCPQPPAARSTRDISPTESFSLSGGMERVEFSTANRSDGYYSEFQAPTVLSPSSGTSSPSIQRPSSGLVSVATNLPLSSSMAHLQNSDKTPNIPQGSSLSTSLDPGGTMVPRGLQPEQTTPPNPQL